MDDTRRWALTAKCRELCRKGTCDMSCTVAGRKVQWCAEVEESCK